MPSPRYPSQIANDFTEVDISSGMTNLPTNTVAVSFRVTTAGNLKFKGVGSGAATIERPFDTGTYRLPGRYAQVGPGTTATIAVLSPADEVIAEHVSAID